MKFARGTGGWVHQPNPATACCKPNAMDRSTPLRGIFKEPGLLLFQRMRVSYSEGARTDSFCGPLKMPIRLSFVVALAFALALPGFASTVRHPVAATRPHRRPAHDRHVSVSHRHRTRISSSHALLKTQPAARHATIPALARVRFVPPLRGSRASLLRQNERDDAEGLLRIQDDEQLDQLEADGSLVAIPASYTLLVNPGLPSDRRYCRPWTARFLADLARVHYARFHRPLQVNSAVRTVAFQRALMQINGNAAAADGDLASPHLTGAAIDIGKKGLSLSEIAWMRAWLLPLQTAGKIDVEEEFYQACFHITVYRSYVPRVAPRTPRRRASTTLLAAGIR